MGCGISKPRGGDGVGRRIPTRASMVRLRAADGLQVVVWGSVSLSDPLFHRYLEIRVGSELVSWYGVVCAHLGPLLSLLFCLTLFPPPIHPFLPLPEAH